MSCAARHPMYDRPCEVAGTHNTEGGYDLHETTYDGERLRWTQPLFTRIGTVPCSCGETPCRCDAGVIR